MITINELFANPNDERVVETLNKLETFAEEHYLEMGDYAGTLDYMNFESDDERVDAIEAIIALADEEVIDFDECDSIENLFYREIDILSEELGNCLNSYAYDFLGISEAIKETNAAYQREISERAMYELANKKSEICDKLADIVTILDDCLKYKDKE